MSACLHVYTSTCLHHTRRWVILGCHPAAAPPSIHAVENVGQNFDRAGLPRSKETAPPREDQHITLDSPIVGSQEVDVSYE